MVKINGESMDVAGKNLRQFLEEQGYDLSRIVVEQNLEIVPSDTFADVYFADGDMVEILKFVGGG